VRLAVQAARRVECQRTSEPPRRNPVGRNAVRKGLSIVQTDDAEVETVRQVNRCWKEKGYKSADCAPADQFVAALDPIIALCHNPVQGRRSMCGREGLVSRPGDLRTTKLTSSVAAECIALGLRPDAGRPAHRRSHSGGINVWNSVTDQAAQSMVDVIRWMNGELPDYQVTSGATSPSGPGGCRPPPRVVSLMTPKP